jgi:Pyridoxamine 5'-phosphate oxidase
MPKTATADRVERDALLEFLRPRHQAVLVTRRSGGGVQLSPVTCGIDPDGRVVVSTYPQRAKAANARREPAVSLCVLSSDWNGPWRKDPRAPHRSHARGGPLHEGRNR